MEIEEELTPAASKIEFYIDNYDNVFNMVQYLENKYGIVVTEWRIVISRPEHYVTLFFENPIDISYLATVIEKLEEKYLIKPYYSSYVQT